MEDLKYPTGKYNFHGEVTREIADHWKKYFC
jgi:hypothetical protein